MTSMIDKGWEIVGVDCVYHIKEELPLWSLFGEELVREVGLDLLLVLDER